LECGHIFDNLKEAREVPTNMSYPSLTAKIPSSVVGIDSFAGLPLPQTVNLSFTEPEPDAI
jgi:hypothetical protein